MSLNETLRWSCCSSVCLLPLWQRDRHAINWLTHPLPTNGQTVTQQLILNPRPRVSQ